jgi:hypothetical protein
MHKLFPLKTGFILTNSLDMNMYLHAVFILNKGKGNSSIKGGIFFLRLSNQLRWVTPDLRGRGGQSGRV